MFCLEKFIIPKTTDLHDTPDWLQILLSGSGYCARQLSLEALIHLLLCFFWVTNNLEDMSEAKNHNVTQIHELFGFHHFWSNYSTFTRPHPKKVAEEGEFPLFQGNLGPRLLKYYILARLVIDGDWFIVRLHPFAGFCRVCPLIFQYNGQPTEISMSCITSMTFRLFITTNPPRSPQKGSE